MKIMNFARRAALALFFAAALGGCASMDRQRNATPEPDARLGKLVDLYRSTRATQGNCYEIWAGGSAGIDCERVQREIGRLAVEFPAHKGIQLADAIVNYDAGRKESAQVQLDMLLVTGDAPPEASQLRARIALETGNRRLARRLVDNALRQYPRTVALHELSAAIHYLNEDFSAAEHALELADRMGAEGWRVDYHRGLLNEAIKHWPAACVYYQSVLLQKPNDRGAESRLFALEAQGHCEFSQRPASGISSMN